MSHMPGNISGNVLADSIVEDGFSHQDQPVDSSSMQAGSSLGSLFLDSVEDMLSNEKTTQQFPTPQGKVSTQKTSKTKMTKQAQLLNDKTPHTGMVGVSQNTIDSSPVSFYLITNIFYLFLYFAAHTQLLLE